MHLINNLSHDRPILQSDWRVEIPQRRTENSSQVHQTLFLILEVGSGHETTLASAYVPPPPLHSTHPQFSKKWSCEENALIEFCMRRPFYYV